MKQMIWKLIKFSLIAVVILALVGVVFGLVAGIGWSWWVGFFILLGLLGLALGFVLLKKIFIRRRERRFVQQVIEQDDAYRTTLSDKDKEGAKELQEKWKQAMAALRRSHLKKYGNPLYVLPWYLVIGESGSGKTTAIQSAGLSSPFAEVSRTSGISGTRNCDWWFFEQAIVLDTAGRYAIPVDEGRDKDEWQKFLGLLAKFRKKEPINGLVVTIAADKLASVGPDELEEDGRSIRRRVDELMRVLGAKFPVYVLVTKCDLVQGMTSFSDMLPEETLAQAMGTMNEDLSTDVENFTKNSIQSLVERLKELRLLLFHKSRLKAVDPGLLLFPDEFERLKPGLRSFMKGAFEETPYQEKPIVRGLFFSSGKQEGSPYSHFLKELGLIEERDVLPGTSKGLFLHDFFSRILPADRGLFAPTQRTMEWSRLTQNLGLAAWLTVAIAICGLMSFSFAKNMMIMKAVSKALSKPVVFQNEIVADVISMDQFRQTILKVEEQNRGWWIPRFGLTESLKVENELKAEYCKQFYDGLLRNNNREMAETITQFSAATPQAVIGVHVAHLVRRINLLGARLENEDLESLLARPQPYYERTLQSIGQEVIPEVGQKLTGLYFYYLFWREDSNILNQELNELRMLLRHILMIKDANLHWMVTWINLDPVLSSLTLQDFWGGSLVAADERPIAPAFTITGKTRIDSFIKEMESALIDPMIIAGQKLEFQTWYRNAYFTAWHDFGLAFPSGAQRLKDKTEWRQVASKMGSEHNPYFDLMDRITKELAPFSMSPELPLWLKRVYDFKATNLKAKQLLEKKGKKAGILKKATKKVQSKIAKLEKKSGVDVGGLESRLIAAQALRDYQDALAEMEPVSASREISYQMAAAIYKDDPTTSKTPFFAGWRAMEQLKLAMAETGPDQELFWKLVQGPLNYFLVFVSREAACQLQKIWERDVLLEVQGVSNRNELIKLLLDQNGYAKKFVKGPAKPFIASSLKKGFYDKEIMGNSVPFDKYFFSFLNKGSRSVQPVQASYTVTIKGEPTGANKEASVIPHATELEMQCADKTLKLVNLNYPVRKRFKWSPQDCGDVTFRIKIANLALTKKYGGNLAFAKFLNDFQKGTRTFYPSEFPNEAADLKRMGIRYIKAKYQFAGHRPALGLLRTGPGRVPEEIVACWDQ
jgi:type VI secretion system protein ImpL